MGVETENDIEREKKILKQNNINKINQRDVKSTLKLFIDTHKPLTLYLSFWYVGKWLKTPLLKHHVSISTTLLKINFAFFYVI